MTLMLTDTQRAVLDFETTHQHWKHGGTKESAVRARFGMSEARYYMVLGDLLRRPEALEYAPVTVSRLCRLRDVRREARGLLRRE